MSQKVLKMIVVAVFAEIVPELPLLAVTVRPTKPFAGNVAAVSVRPLAT